MKWISIACGIALIALIAWLGRYQVQVQSAGAGVGTVVRLDRWTGRVDIDCMIPGDTRLPRRWPAAADEYEKLAK